MNENGEVLVVARLIDRMEEGFIALLLVSMTLLVFAEVVMRFVFSTGVLWMEELTLHVSAWLVLFGASWGVKKGAHIGVDVVVKALPARVRRMVSGFAVLLCLLYCGLFLYGAWVYIAKLRKIGIEMEDIVFPKWIAHSILLIGFTLLAIRFVQLFARIVKGESDGFEVVDEATEALLALDREREDPSGEPAP